MSKFSESIIGSYQLSQLSDNSKTFLLWMDSKYQKINRIAHSDDIIYWQKINDVIINLFWNQYHLKSLPHQLVFPVYCFFILLYTKGYSNPW